MTIDKCKIFPTQAIGKITKATHIRLTTILVLATVLIVAGTCIAGTASAESGATIVSTSTEWLGSDYSVTVTYTLAGATDYDVELQVFDIGDNLIKVVDGGHKNSGTYTIIWDGTKTDGTRAPDGSYNVKIYASDSGSVTETPVKDWTIYEAPRGIAIDNAGNIYVTDTGNNAVKKIDNSGKTTSIGTGFYIPSGVAVDSSGNVYVADTNSGSIKKIDTTGTTTTLATGFNMPRGVAVDNAGYVYVADTGNNAIKKIGGTGVVTATFTGFKSPGGVAVDNAGNIYVADTGNNSIAKIDTTGATTILASGLYGPYGVAIDKAGNIYVADTTNNAVKRFDSTGTLTANVLGFAYPNGVAVDSAGNIYVADTTNNAIKKIVISDIISTTTIAPGFGDPCGVALDNAGNIYLADGYTVKKINAAGEATTIGPSFNTAGGVVADSAGNIYITETATGYVKKINPAGSATNIGTGFRGPNGIAIDNAGNIYVAETNNNTLKKIGTNEQITLIATGFSSPRGVAVDNAGNIYVADYGNHAVKKIDINNQITTIGTGVYGPRGVAVDNAGNIYVADFDNQVVRKISSTGATTTIASGFNYPCAVAVNSENLYVVDRRVIADYSFVKVSSASSSVNIATPTATPIATPTTTPIPTYPMATIVGISTGGQGSDYSVTVTYTLAEVNDDNVELRIYDAGNNLIQTVNGGQKDSGTYTIVWDGTKTDGARAPYGAYSLKVYAIDYETLTEQPVRSWSIYKSPRGIAVDGAGNIYVADTSNNAIIKIDTTGTTTTLATGFNRPSSVAVDSIGNVYVADTGNNAIIKIDTTGTTTSFGSIGFNNPYGVAVDSTGNVYVADTYNNTIKKFDTAGTLVRWFPYNLPNGVAVDSAGNIYVTSSANWLSCIDTSGYERSVDTGFIMNDVAIDGAGNRYVTDNSNNAIKKIDTTGTITTIATGFQNPVALAVGSHTLYVSDDSGMFEYSFEFASSDATGVNIEDPIVTPTPVPSGVPGLKVVPGTVTAGTVETTTFGIIVDSLPEGLSGYDLHVSLGNPETAKINSVSLPLWATTPPSSYQTIATNEVRISAIDLQDILKPGASQVTLATINVVGLKPGTTTITISNFRMDDDVGDPVLPEITGGSLTVYVVQAFPGLTKLPTDPDGDGLYEDINGNGRLDFNDVVLLYQNMDWVRQNTIVGIAPFDFNGSGALDFDDIVVLYTEVLG